jgi:hypothetical protein
MGQDLLDRVRKSLLTWCRPDRVERRAPLNGRPYWAAVKALPAPGRDAWGREVAEDSVHAADCALAGYAGDGEWAFREPSPEELMNKEYGFLLVSAEKQDEVIDELSKYIELDTDDIRGPLLGALYAIGVRPDSPNPEWNDRARRLIAQEEWEREQKYEDYVRECLSELEFPYEQDGHNAIVSVAGASYRVPHIRVREANRFFRKLVEITEKKAAILAGKLPLITYSQGGGRIGECYLKGNTLTVPTGIAGKVIGRGGKNIKELAEFLGLPAIRVRTDDSLVVRGWWRLAVEPSRLEIPCGIERIFSEFERKPPKRRLLPGSCER